MPKMAAERAKDFFKVKFKLWSKQASITIENQAMTMVTGTGMISSQWLNF